ncbi:MAG: hypothetical protein ABJH63_15380 [Rhizobiaceae bacterium]
MTHLKTKSQVGFNASKKCFFSDPSHFSSFAKLGASIGELKLSSLFTNTTGVDFQARKIVRLKGEKLEKWLGVSNSDFCDLDVYYLQHLLAPKKISTPLLQADLELSRPALVMIDHSIPSNVERPLIHWCLNLHQDETVRCVGVLTSMTLMNGQIPEPTVHILEMNESHRCDVKIGLQNHLMMAKLQTNHVPINIEN